VKSRVTLQFRQEVERFDLRFTCESCAHYEPDQQRCAHGYPTAVHRARALDDVEHWLFCKEFELA
jgi:hypothetical protein